MRNVGIMQGRVCPDRTDELQRFPAADWRRELQEIRALGFDCAELLADRELACRAMLADAAFRARCREIAPSVCADFLTTLSAIDRPVEFLNALDRIACIAGGLGVQTIVVPFFGENQITTATELAVALNGLPEMGNCTLAIEADLPAEEMIDLLDGTGLGVCYDVGNARSAGRLPQEEILLLAERVVHVHLKDRAVRGPNVPLGEGDVDFEACFDALDEIGYEGDLILETAYGDDPRQSAARHLHFVRERLAGVPA
jgi:hexulose-6-phosphate isomerase